MLLELLSEMHSDFYPVYFYISYMLSVICSYGVLYFTSHYLSRNNSLTNKNKHAIQPNKDTYLISLNLNNDIRAWITRKVKRIAGPDDDTDKPFFSYIYTVHKTRGGQLCSSNLYSLF
ncbi:hypothetical protein [Aquibacillus rhizosphaerae]|uniref:Uncharacterized protein n=1 Tax=Aquibacillus rhizosphaerae TaxID=3051431 RepID=A0ABT7L5I3_9BACI|nr:hypothetical protein [Aquibacillus sp. LR5S19]MDL4841127.1 hypothetical protein [Aquibacillus sp. LR5S19]